MSDVKRTYRAIRQALDSMFSDHITGRLAQRLNVLACIICGMVRSRSSNIPAIGCAFPGKRDEASKP